MKASSPLSHSGSLRAEIKYPKQGSTKSPLLGDKGSGPGASTQSIPPGSPPPAASPSLHSVTLPPSSPDSGNHSLQPLHPSLSFPIGDMCLQTLWDAWAPPISTGAPQGRAPCLTPLQTQLGAIRTVGSISLAQRYCLGHLPTDADASLEAQVV